MQRNRLCLLLVVFLFGCSSATPFPTTAPATATVPPPATSTALPGYAEKIRNAEYQLGATDALKIVQLADGKFQQGAPGDVDYVSVTLTDFIASGDLNDDGKDEVAALVAENYGGSGVFTLLAVYADQNGKLTFQTSLLLDDRPQLNALAIEKGEVFLDAVAHASQDPACCPTLRTNRHYRLLDGQLVMTDYSTFTPDGKARVITIDTPAQGAEVYSSIRFKGSVAIAPFENNLVYRIYSTGDVELASGSITVKASAPGGPGIFDTIIGLGNILSGAVVRVEIQDVNAEDSSLFAMDSVELVVK